MNCFIVFLGGGLGALVRYILYLVLPKISYFPASTLVANFLGCFVATTVFMYFIMRNHPDSAYKTFLIIGFCGGLSTLSALSLELLEFIQNEEYLRAFIYTIVTILLCTASIFLGIIFAKNYFNLKF